MWQGREYDAKTGLYYFRARWYSPETGRWLSKDPIGISGGLNLYAFCGNNPVNFIDPLGLRWFGGNDDGKWDVGRPNTIVPPGGTIGAGLEKYGLGMETMAKIHDPLVGILVPDLGKPGENDTVAEKIIDGVVNIPTMPVAYGVALTAETVLSINKLLAALKLLPAGGDGCEK